MAVIYDTDQTRRPLNLRGGPQHRFAQVQHAVGGYVEIIRHRDGQIMAFDGAAHERYDAPNDEASRIVQSWSYRYETTVVWGIAVVLSADEARSAGL